MARNNVALPIDGNLELGYSTKKKRFSVDGNTDNVVEFDPTDIGVVARLSAALPEFQKLSDKWEELVSIVEEIDTDNQSDEKALQDSQNILDTINNIERSTRDLLDECFDSTLADKLLGNSSAFSPVNGYFKFEHIINALLSCYEQNIKDEAPKFNKRKIQKHTNKYVKR